MTGTTTLDAVQTVIEKLNDLDPEDVAFLVHHPDRLQEAIRTIHARHQQRFAYVRERDEVAIRLAALKDQLRAAEAAVKKPRKGRTEFAALQNEDRAVRTRDDLRRGVESHEETVRYLNDRIQSLS